MKYEVTLVINSSSLKAAQRSAEGVLGYLNAGDDVYLLKGVRKAGDLPVITSRRKRVRGA